MRIIKSSLPRNKDRRKDTIKKDFPQEEKSIFKLDKGFRQKTLYLIVSEA